MAKPSRWHPHQEKGRIQVMLQYLPYMNETCILLSAIFMAIGWGFIRKKQVEIHKRFMILGSVFATLFFIGYALRIVVVGATSFGGPEPLRLPYEIFLQMHSILATVAAILGILVIRLAIKRNFSKHRKLGPWAVSIWFVTVASGLVVFLLLYIFFPPGPTTKVFGS
jgi:putative membrane protein